MQKGACFGFCPVSPFCEFSKKTFEQVSATLQSIFLVIIDQIPSL
jgi:hypothetical protein